jgi:hypothetical protein
LVQTGEVLGSLELETAGVVSDQLAQAVHRPAKGFGWVVGFEKLFQVGHLPTRAALGGAQMPSGQTVTT